MSAHLVRHGQVRISQPDGGYTYATRGQTIEISDEAEAARLTELGALVAVGTDLSIPTDDRPWEQVVQEVADRRYDVVRVPAEGSAR
jgi:hypothetical protein